LGIPSPRTCDDRQELALVGRPEAHADGDLLGRLERPERTAHDIPHRALAAALDRGGEDIGAGHVDPRDDVLDRPLGGVGR